MLSYLQLAYLVRARYARILLPWKLLENYGYYGFIPRISRMFTRGNRVISCEFRVIHAGRPVLMLGYPGYVMASESAK